MIYSDLPKILTSKPIVYLDFDGVLHHYNTFSIGSKIYMKEPTHSLFEWATILEKLLTPYLNQIHIVLSTSWVKTLRYDFSKSQLPKKIQDSCIGGTWHSHMKPSHTGWFIDYNTGHYFDTLSRYQQIKQDSLRRKCVNWVAIDDNNSEWPLNEYNKLILCQSKKGLSDINTQKDLISKLSFLVNN